jgi:hypothetical protein
MIVRVRGTEGQRVRGSEGQRVSEFLKDESLTYLSDLGKERRFFIVVYSYSIL